MNQKLQKTVRKEEATSLSQWPLLRSTSRVVWLSLDDAITRHG